MPERRNRSFEDFTLADRRWLLAQLAWLIDAWPERFVGLMRLEGVTRRPLIVMAPMPAWYDAVAERLSQRSSKRPWKVVALRPHLTLAQMHEREAVATTKLEPERWGILALLVATPYLGEVARTAGVNEQKGGAGQALQPGRP